MRVTDSKGATNGWLRSLIGTWSSSSSLASATFITTKPLKACLRVSCKCAVARVSVQPSTAAKCSVKPAFWLAVSRKLWLAK